MNSGVCSSVVLFASILISNPAWAVVTSGRSAAADVSVEANLTGSLTGVPLPGANVSVGPLNSALGESTPPYALSGPYVNNTLPLVTAGVGGGGLIPLSLSAGVTALEVSARSEVDGLEGGKLTAGRARITSATVDLGVNVVGLAAANLLSLEIAPGPDGTASVFESESALFGAGPPLSPYAYSNFLLSDPTILLFVLGIPVSVDTSLFVTGVPFILEVEVLDVPVLNADVTGTITFTPDFTELSVLGDEYTARATSLLVETDLDVVVPNVLPFLADLVSLNVGASIRVNDSFAAASAVAVPEPGAAALLCAAGAWGARRRRVRSA